MRTFRVAQAWVRANGTPAFNGSHRVPARRDIQFEFASTLPSPVIEKSRNVAVGDLKVYLSVNTVDRLVTFLLLHATRVL